MFTKKKFKKARRYSKQPDTWLERTVEWLRTQVLKEDRFNRRPFLIIPLVTLGRLSLLTLAIFAGLHFTKSSTALDPTDSRIVILSYDHSKQTVPSTAKTVGELLKKMDIDLHSGDVVEPSSDTKILEDNFHVNVYRALPVTIVDGDKKISAVSAATTPRSVARQVGIQTYPEDRLETEATENFLQEGSVGQRVVIKRSTPVFVNLYGTLVQIRTHAKTVDELLKERNIKLARNDNVLPARGSALSEATQVFVTRKGIQIATEEKEIAMPSETVQDNNLSFGTTAVRQQGAPGKKIVTYELQLENGKEVGRKVIQEVVAQEPVKQIIARGKAVNIPSDIQSVMAQAGIGSGDYGYVNYIVSREGGWCPTKLQGQYGVCPGYAPAEIPSNLGYGICQATPGSKMGSAGSDWKTNIVTQLKWCSGYATGRYGSWSGAYDFWQRNHWW